MKTKTKMTEIMNACSSFPVAMSPARHDDGIRLRRLILAMSAVAFGGVVPSLAWAGVCDSSGYTSSDGVTDADIAGCTRITGTGTDIALWKHTGNYVTYTAGDSDLVADARTKQDMFALVALDVGASPPPNSPPDAAARFVVDGDMTIESSLPEAYGILVNSTTARSRGQLIINPGKSVTLTQTGDNLDGAVQVSGSRTKSADNLGEIQVNGTLAVNVPNSGFSKTKGAVSVIANGRLTGSGKVKIVTGDNDSAGLATAAGGAVNMTGTIDATSSTGAWISLLADSTTLDSSNSLHGRSKFTSIGDDDSALLMDPNNLALQTFKAVDLESKGAGADGLRVVSGLISLTDSDITLHEDGGAGIDVYKGNVDNKVIADNVRVVTNGLDSYGILTGRDNGIALHAEIDFSNGTVNTNGERAYALLANRDDFTTNLIDSTLSTHGGTAMDPSYGAYLTAGTVTMGTVTGAGTKITTDAAGAHGIVYAPADPNGVNATFDPSTSIATTGNGAHGFVVSGSDSSGAANAFTFDGNGLQLDHIRVSGANSAMVAAEDGARLVLDGTQLSATTDALKPVASGKPLAWGAKADGAGSRVELRGAAKTNGVGLWAAGGTLAMYDRASASSSLVQVDGGGALDLTRASGPSVNVGSLGGDGTVSLGANNIVLDGADSTTFEGTFTGTGGVDKEGTATQTFSGAGVFQYTGTTTIGGGTLAVAGGSSATGKSFGMANDGTLDISGNGGSFTLGALTGAVGGGHVQLGTGKLILDDSGLAGTPSYGGTIEGAGGVTKQGTGTQTFSGQGAFGYAGETSIENGTLAVVGNVDGSGAAFNIEPNGNLDISGITATTPLDGQQAQAFTAGSLGGQGKVTLGSNSLVVGGSKAMTFEGTISGAGNVVKRGSGSLTLSGEHAFDFTGASYLQGGVLAVRNVDPTTFDKRFVMDGGWLDLSDVANTDINDWRELNLTDGVNAAQGGVIGANDRISYDVAAGSNEAADYALGDGTPSGSGLYLLKTGDGTLTLTGNNRYVGNTRVEGGTLKVFADENLGDVRMQREVVLDGGNLEVAGSFDTGRQIQLRQDGSVTVDGAGTSTTWDSADGGVASTRAASATAAQAHVLTKLGEGRLAFAGVSHLGGVVVGGGVLDMGAAEVASSTTQPAVTVHAGTVSFTGATLSSAGDAIVADGDGTVQLSNTSITPGAGAAIYRAVSGAHANLDASNQVLNGLLAADGAGSHLNIELSDGSQYTGTPGQLNGGTVGLDVADASSIWNLTGSAAVDALHNAGTIAMAEPIGGNYTNLRVAGNYASDNGQVVLHTDLNQGGDLTHQHTDRLLIEGNVSGQTILSLQTTGDGSNTNVAGNNQVMPKEGISVVQVGGSAAADSFKLAHGYVNGGPFQYGLYAVDTPDASQSQLASGKAANWDYRLMTTYIDDQGNPHPGLRPDNSEPNNGPSGGRPAIVPQGSSYLVSPLAVQNYGATIVSDLTRRLGDIRRGDAEQDSDKGEMFARTVGNWGSYRSSQSSQHYGYDFGQDIHALQIGGNWLHLSDDNQYLRLGVAGAKGTTSVSTRTNLGERSSFSLNAYNMSLTGTWHHKDGWYADAVVSAGHYDGWVSTPQRGRHVAMVKARSKDASLEMGRSVVLDNGVRVEPQVQVMYQRVRFDKRTDVDGVQADIGGGHALTAKAGVRVGFPVVAAATWMPYVRAGLQRTWDNWADARLSGHAFGVANVGSAVDFGAGATGQLRPDLSVYGEVSGQRYLAGHGFGNASVNLGLRYTF